MGRWEDTKGARWVKVDEEPKRLTLQFDDADTAFILGKGGKTKQKIARVSGARLELHERNNTVEIVGPEEAEINVSSRFL